MRQGKGYTDAQMCFNTLHTPLGRHLFSPCILTKTKCKVVELAWQVQECRTSQSQ